MNRFSPRRAIGALMVSSLAIGGALTGCETAAPPDDETDAPPATIDAVDLLFVVDNSFSMRDKQVLLADSVPDLVGRLLNPRCVDPSGLTAGSQPASASDACPEGTTREFAPVTDLHVGVISSSLGALTANQCDQLDSGEGNQGARLLTRASDGSEVPSEQGVIGWRAGEDAGAFIERIRQVVLGVDQLGCGYEMPLEAMTRFLVEPQPYASLSRTPENTLRKEGVDEVLLAQREAFLRPGSLLTVVLLSDENDCSVSLEGLGFLTLEQAPFYRPTAGCAEDPNGACCTSCGMADQLDASCGDPGCSAPMLTGAEDGNNVRCWNQKERYGVNFLYPTQRYVNALSQRTIDPARADLEATTEGVTNPIFRTVDGFGRTPERVVFSTLIGVPWQAIARRRADGTPDASLGYKTNAELEAEGAFPRLVGDPDANVPPTDPFLIESVEQRVGASSLTGFSLPGANDVNGGERSPEPNDLQATCIFDLAEPVEGGAWCSGCEEGCVDPACDGTTQIAARAYPGLREMAVARGLGAQGSIASLCPVRGTDVGVSATGYRPAAGAVVDQMAVRLRGE